MDTKVGVTNDQGAIEARLRNVREEGDQVRLSRTGYDVKAAYFPPNALTEGAGEYIGLDEVRELCARIPEVGIENGFNLALMLGTFETSEKAPDIGSDGMLNLLAQMGRSVKAGDEDGVNQIADLLKSNGFYK